MLGVDNNTEIYKLLSAVQLFLLLFKKNLCGLEFWTFTVFYHKDRPFLINIGRELPENVILNKEIFFLQ